MTFYEITVLWLTILMWIGIRYIISVIFSYCFWFCVFLITKYKSISFENCTNVDECYETLKLEFWKCMHYTLWFGEYNDTNKPTGIVFIPIFNIAIIIMVVIVYIIKLIIFIVKTMKIKWLLRYIYNIIKNTNTHINVLFHNILKNIKLK